MSAVIIVGAGLSGCLLARHLLRAVPGIEITLVDRRVLPGPARFALGESTSEAGAWYLESLGLRAHLEAHHRHKFGLRFFLSRPQGSPFHRRAEFGIQTCGMGHCSDTDFQGTRPATWHLDRSVLDAHLLEALRPHVRVIDRAVVREVEPGVLHLACGPLRARWIVDASRTGVVPMEPVQPIDHHFQAAWTWVEGHPDPDGFSDDARYRDRLAPGMRWRSTGHFVSPGVWVWTIPLPTHTSIGIVAHPDLALPRDPQAFHAFLTEREPELAAALPLPTQVFHRRVQASLAPSIVDPRGFARTGDAAGFLDPLYSSAMDRMLLVNQLLVLAIHRDNERTCRFANVVHTQLSSHFQHVYSGLYDLLGDPQVMLAKVNWDNAIYFGGVVPLLTRGALANDDFFQRHGHHARNIATLQERMQETFRTWRIGQPASGVVDIGRSAHLLGGLARLRDETPLDEALAAAVPELEALAVGLLQRRHGRTDAFSPYTMQARGRVASPDLALSRSLEPLWTS